MLFKSFFINSKWDIGIFRRQTLQIQNVNSAEYNVISLGIYVYVWCKVNLSQHKVNVYETKKKEKKKTVYTTNKSLLTGFKRFCNYISLQIIL